jgi:Uma2 family endonuclease
MAVEVVPSVEVRKKLTPDDVWAMMVQGELDKKGWELIGGEIVEVPPSEPADSETGLDIVVPLRAFALKAGARVFESSAGFLVGSDRRQLRAPDASYVSRERAFILDSKPWANGAPDLAVEVLSEGQYGRAYAHGKVREYFEAGAQLVWLIDRRRKEVRVYRANSDEYTIYRNDAVLTLEPIIAGFELKVSDIFR